MLSEGANPIRTSACERNSLTSAECRSQTEVEDPTCEEMERLLSKHRSVYSCMAPRSSCCFEIFEAAIPPPIWNQGMQPWSSSQCVIIDVQKKLVVKREWPGGRGDAVEP